MTDKIQTRAERRKRLQENKNKKKPKTKGIFKKIILSLLILAVVGLVAGIGTFAYYVSKTPELDEALLKDPVSSKIYFMFLKVSFFIIFLDFLSSSSISLKTLSTYVFTIKDLFA